MNKSRKSSRILSTGIASVIAAAAAFSPGHAATIYWDGTGTLWSDVVAWSTASGTTTPNPAAVPGAADIAQFNITAVNTAQTVSLNANQSALGLLFSSTGTTLLQGSAGNRTLTLGASGIVVNSGAGAPTIGSATVNQNVSVTMSAAQSWTNNALSLLSIVNNVTNGGFLLTSGGTGNTAISGIIGGTGGLTKTGGGTLTLSGVNTFTGTTTVSAGIVRATTSTASLGAGALTLSGGTLQLANDAGLNYGRNTTVTANTTIVSDRNVAAGAGVTHTLGTLAIGAQTLSITRGALATSGTGAVTFGSTTLSGASTFDPQTNTTLTLGAIHGGVNGFTKTGGGTLVLSAASTHTGDTTVASGVLQINNNNGAGNGAISISSGAPAANRVLVNGGVTIFNPISFGTTLGTAGFGVIQQTGTGQATVNGPITITGAPTAGGHFVGSNTVGSELVIGGAISSTVSLSHRAGRIIYKGGGTVTAVNPTLTVTDTALIGATNGMVTSLTVFLGGSGNAALDLNGFDQTLSGLLLGNGGLNYVGTVNLGAKALTLTGNVTTQTPGGVTGAHTINATAGGTLALGASPRTFTVSDSLSLDDLTLNAVAVTGAGGMVKEGTGTLSLNNATIAGPLTINNGALQSGTSSLIGTVTSGALNFSANPTTLKMKLGIAGDDLINTGVLTTNGIGATTVSLSQVGGAAPLGTKTLIDYTGAGPGIGGFTLGALPGRLAGALADTGSAIVFNATANDQVVWDGTNGPSWSEGATGNWKLLSNSSQNDYLAGDVVNFQNTPTNTQVDIAVNVAPSHVTFSNTVAGATDYLVTGGAGITGPTSVVKTGDAKVTLVNPNSYTGATTVSAGTLELDHDATGNVVLSATSGVSVANVATMKLTRDDGPFTFNRNLSGAGTVEINPHSAAGGATAHGVVLSGNNAGFTGLMTLAAPLSGTYRLTSVVPSALGAATIDVQSGAQVFTAANQTYTNNIFIAGTGFADSAGNIGALRLEAGSNWAGNVAVNTAARIGSHNGTATVSGAISGGDLEVNATNFNNSYTLIFTGTNSYGSTTIGGQNIQTAGTPSMRLNIGNGGTTGSLGTGTVIIHGDGANGVLGFDRSNGYTLAVGQSITGAVGAGTIANSITRTFIDFDTRGAGFSDNGNSIVLGAAAPTSGGNIRIGQSRADTVTNITGTLTAEKIQLSGVAAAINPVLNIGAGANVSANFFTVGEVANGTGGVVNQTGGALNVLGQLRVGHFGTLTATYNMSGGSITLTGASPNLTPSTAGAGAANATGDNNINGTATATIHGGGIYLGIDGTGIFNHTGGSVTTNWIVLDNRGDTGPANNMADGIDRYTINGATAALNLRSTYGLIARNTSTAVVFGNGTVRVDNTGTGTGTGANINIPLDATIDTLNGTTTTLDTNGAGNGLTLPRDVRGTGTLNLINGGTVSITTAGVQNISANILGTANLTKLGNGATTLAGNAAGYTGNVTVSAGQLNVPNTLAASSIVLADGTVLSGEPTVGAATFGTAVRADLIFNPNTAGAFTAGTLTLPNGTTDNLVFSAAPTGAGPWTAVNYITKVGTGFFGLLGSGSYRVAPVVTDTGSSITVNVTGTKALTWTAAGATATAWDNNVNVNWADTTPAPDKFFAGDTVTFADGPAVIAITVAAGGVSPWKTTVNSNTNNYTINAGTSGIFGPGSLEKFGASTLTLSGANTYAGPTTVGGGILLTATAASLGNGGPTNGITINGGGRLSFTSTTAHDLGVNRHVAIGAGGGSISHNATAAVAITIPGNITGSDPLSFHSNSTGAGTFVLTGNNSGYTGAITVDAQGTGLTTLRIATPGAAPTGGSITLNYPASGANGNASTLDLPGTTLPAGVTLNMTSFLNGAISQRSQVTSNGNAFIHGPITAVGTSIVQFNPASGTLTLNGPVTVGAGTFNGPSSVFFVRGVGNGVVNNTVTLPGAQFSKTDAGSWTVNSNGNDWASTGVLVGTLKMGVANVLPAAANLILGQNDANAATLDLNGFNQTAASLVSNPTTPNVNTVPKSITSATPATLTINQATTTTYASLITGEVSFEKSGTGKLSLLGANSHNGLTTVSNGVLNIQHRTALGSVTGGTSVANGATLEVQGNLFIGAESLSLNGPGAGGSTGALVNVSGTNTYGGLITVATNSTISAQSGSTLILIGGVDKTATTATFTGGGTIILNGAPVSGSLSGSDLVIDGVGVNMNVASTYNGPTFIKGGGLLINGANQALPNVSKLTLGDATTNSDGTWFVNGTTQTIGGLASAGTGVKSVTLGGGALTVDQATDTVYDGSITGAGSFEKKGAGRLALTGIVNIPTVNVNDGTFDLHVALGTGASTINANDVVNLGVSQTLAALNIGEGGIVNLGSLPPPAPSLAVGGEPLFAQGGDMIGSPTQAVPEPGSAALLLGGIATLLGFRRRHTAAH